MSNLTICHNRTYFSKTEQQKTVYAFLYAPKGKGLAACSCKALNFLVGHQGLEPRTN